MSKYDWSNVPKEVKWIATDIHGWTFGYIPKPPRLDGGYWFGDYDIFCLGKNLYNGYWAESMEERPDVD